MALYSTKVYRIKDKLTVANGGEISVEAGGKLSEPVEAGTTAANLKNYGVTQLTQTAKKVYTLATPTAGLRKTIYSTVGTTTAHGFVYAGATVQFTTNSAQRYMRFSKAAKGFVNMIALSTTRWLVLNKTTSVAYTTSSTGA